MHFSAEEESGRKNLFSETDNFINEQSKNKSRAFAMDHNDFSSMVLLFESIWTLEDMLLLTSYLKKNNNYDMIMITMAASSQWF